MEIERNPDRITKILRKQAERLNFDGSEFPVNLKDIDKFERLNPEIKVNVLDMKQGVVFFLWEHPSTKEKKSLFVSFFLKTNIIVLSRIFQDLSRCKFQNIVVWWRFVIGALTISQTRKLWKSIKNIVKIMIL